MKTKIHQLFEELLAIQKKEVLKIAERLLPGVTEEDLLQPNDFPVLETHPEFRYEEGVLHGIQLTEMALQQLLLVENEQLK